MTPPVVAEPTAPESDESKQLPRERRESKRGGSRRRRGRRGDGGFNRNAAERGIPATAESQAAIPPEDTSRQSEPSTDQAPKPDYAAEGLAPAPAPTTKMPEATAATEPHDRSDESIPTPRRPPVRPKPGRVSPHYIDWVEPQDLATAPPEKPAEPVPQENASDATGATEPVGEAQDVVTEGPQPSAPRRSAGRRRSRGRRDRRFGSRNGNTGTGSEQNSGSPQGEAETADDTSNPSPQENQD